MNKVKIKIGDLFNVLDIDNDKYEELQTIVDEILIKTPNGDLVPILGFVKKDKMPMVKIELEDDSSVTCSTKHIFVDENKNNVFASDANEILTIDGMKKITSKEEAGYDYAYDISIPAPHLYCTPNGIIHHNTTCARILANAVSGYNNRDSADLFDDPVKPLFINASSESGVDVVRHTITPYCTADNASGKLKVVILDEMEESSERFQTALREVMERFYSSTRFIFTCNFVNKVIDPLKSRTQHFPFGEMSKKDIALRLKNILKAEKVEFDNANLASVIKDNGTDMRKIINILQRLTHEEGGQRILGKYSKIDESHTQLLSLIKQKKLSDFRKLLLELNPNYDELTYFLFDQAFRKKISEDNWVEIMNEMADVAKNIKLGVNPEITLVNGVSQCMQLMD